MSRFSLFFSTLLFGSYYCEETKINYEGYKGYLVEGDRLDDIKYLFDTSHEAIALEETSEGLEFVVAPRFEATFKRALEDKGLKATLEYSDISEIINIQKNIPKSDTFSWTRYYDVDNIYSYLRRVEASYNETEIIVGGKSYEGRPILGLRILTGNEETKTDKPAVFIESGIHAREWITPAVTTYFINELLTNADPRIQFLRDSFDWHIFPTTNPDGYHYTHTVDRYWRKTRSQSPNGCHGADPNRNWDHNWRGITIIVGPTTVSLRSSTAGQRPVAIISLRISTAGYRPLPRGGFSTSGNPCHYDLYAGSRPFSEIETRTLSKYIFEISNLLAYIGVHSYGQMLLIPYSDTTDHCDNYDDLVRIGNTSISYGERVNGAKYEGPATAGEILYKASGGSMDWVREMLGTPLVFTYELRGKYFHWPENRIPEQGDEFTQMMLGLFLEAGELGYF